jgi:hypothetical protein
VVTSGVIGCVGEPHRRERHASGPLWNLDQVRVTVDADEYDRDQYDRDQYDDPQDPDD